MRKRTRRSPERASALPRGGPARPERPGFAFRSRIPGVRIAYIGPRNAAVDEIGAYWRARGAAFAFHAPGADGSLGGLGQVLERADIALVAAGGLGPDAERRLEACCGRMERPLITLEEGSLSAVEQALRTWYPLLR
jgi:hypothetical protein